jgi:Restriction endonuclease
MRSGFGLTRRVISKTHRGREGRSCAPPRTARRAWGGCPRSKLQFRNASPKASTYIRKNWRNRLRGILSRIAPRRGLNQSRLAEGADSGRDIVGFIERTDVDRTKYKEKWFIDCKHHKRGVPVGELRNLLAWAEAERPDVALFIVSGFLTNPAKDYLQNYKRNNRPPFKIKYWERPTIEDLTRGKREFLQAFGLLKVNMRSERTAIRAEREIFDRVWYYRRLVSISNAKDRGEDISKWDIGKAPAKRLRKKYGPGIGKYMSDFDWGFLQGKMSAIRWVLGDEWDFLDT